MIRHIRQRREELQYSQHYMSAKLRICQNAYSKIELGLSKLTVERLLMICALLDLRASELIEFTIYQQTA